MLIKSNIAIAFFQFFLRMKIGGIAIFPFIFVPKNAFVTERLLNHERIHLRQQLEMLILPFYIIYLYEYYTKGYMNVSFEKEAYANEHNMEYLKKRKLFAFTKYYGKT
jgi:hypothetical protein